MNKPTQILLTIIGAILGIALARGIKSGVSAASQCWDLSPGTQITLPSGATMRCN